MTYRRELSAPYATRFEVAAQRTCRASRSHPRDKSQAISTRRKDWTSSSKNGSVKGQPCHSQHPACQADRNVDGPGQFNTFGQLPRQSGGWRLRECLARKVRQTWGCESVCSVAASGRSSRRAFNQVSRQLLRAAHFNLPLESKEDCFRIRRVLTTKLKCFRTKGLAESLHEANSPGLWRLSPLPGMAGLLNPTAKKLQET